MYKRQAETAGIDVSAYEDGLKAMREAAEEQNKKIDDINNRYKKAVADGASERCV